MAFPIYLEIMLIYFIMNYPISVAAGRLERRLV